VNGGADLGYKVTPQLALTLGYRYGHQYQQQYSFSPYSSSSDYQRVLAGIEGNPWSWLSVKIQGGPDFRSYQGDSATHTTPVNDLHPVKYFGEALITATFAPENTLTFKTKSWQWVSGLGKTPYFDSAYELVWHRRLMDKLALDLGGKILDWDFNSGNLPTCRRNDLQYTTSAGLGYAVNSHVSITLAGVLNWGRNAESDVTNPGARQFNQQLISLGTQWKF
jgi:opacity protein-like surface antigen